MDELTTRNVFALKAGLERALERTHTLEVDLREVRAQIAQVNMEMAALRQMAGQALALAQGGGATSGH